VKSFKPDFYALAIIDIMMPKMGGFDLYERLKKLDPDLKVCFLTASEMYHQEVREVEHCALQNCLKTASGFGGCNAAIILHKDQ